jgi:hypothetical protein
VAEIVEMAAPNFAHESRIRDEYAGRLAELRPAERMLKTEAGFSDSRVRADMRTVDETGLLRVWEFKLAAGYEGLGQALTYLALARKDEGFARPVKAVLAAFEIQAEIITAVEVLNLGVELVVIPPKLRLAGGIPVVTEPPVIPDIPYRPHFTRIVKES